MRTRPPGEHRTRDRDLAPGSQGLVLDLGQEARLPWVARLVDAAGVASARSKLGHTAANTAEDLLFDT